MSRIESTSLSQQVSDDLGKAILSGNFGAESCLPTENKLCEEYGISRTAIREAIKMLSAKGLVSCHSRNGIKIMPTIEWNLFDSRVLKWMLESNPSLSLVREFFQVRLAVETEAAALAASNGKPSALIAMRDSVKVMNAAANDPGINIEQAEIEFHTQLLLASNNPFFAQLSQFVRAALLLSVKLSPYEDLTRVETAYTHARLFQAIESQDSERARMLMNYYLEGALLTIENKIEASQNHQAATSAAM